MENITDYVNQLCSRHRELLQEDCTNTDEFLNLTSELQSVYGLECDSFGFFTLEQLEEPYVTVCYLEDLQDDKPIIKWSIEKKGLSKISIPMGIYTTRLELPKAVETHKKQLESLEKLRDEKVKQMQDWMQNNSLDNRYKDKVVKKNYEQELKNYTPYKNFDENKEKMAKARARVTARLQASYIDRLVNH